MDKLSFEKICNAVSSVVDGLGENYNVVHLEDQNNGCIRKRFIVEVNGQNYLQIDSGFLISRYELFPNTKFQIPVYYCVPDSNWKYILNYKDVVVLNKDEFSIDQLIKMVFGEAEEQLQKRENVANLLNKYLDSFILPENIGYDANEQTFHLINWDKTNGPEYRFFSEYFQTKKDQIFESSILGSDCIAKYTSLETALEILKSGKIRVMSVTAMNDRMEIGHLYGKLSNDKSAYLEDKTKIYFARQRYLTSFTTRIDDLTMWRLYGNQGRGVCLLFSEPYNCDFYYPIDYASGKSEIIKTAKLICNEIEELGMSFTFKSIETIWQYFHKQEGFSDEKELRYLRIDKTLPDGYILASNGIVSGYKDLLLTGDYEIENRFPCCLQGIILGPNMKNVDVNMYQLENLAHERGIPLFKGVKKSTINYFLDDL